MKNKFALFICLLVFSIPLCAQTLSKRSLQPSDYNVWKEVKNQQISPFGSYIVWEENPLRGDGTLFIHSEKNTQTTQVANGAQAMIASDESFIIYRKKIAFDSLRKLKLKKIKEDKLPKDSVVVFFAKTGIKNTIAGYKSVKTSEKKPWAYILTEPALDKTKTDSTKLKKKTGSGKKEKSKIKLSDLYIVTNTGLDSKPITSVSEVVFSEKGNSIAYIRQINDSIDSCYVYVQPFRQNARLVSAMAGEAQKLCISEDGLQIAFLKTSDTTKIKSYRLFYWNPDFKNAYELNPRQLAGQINGFEVSVNYQPWFSEKGNRLFIGMASPQKETPKDTLLPEEKAVFDLWSWNDPLIMPQQLKNLDKEKKKSFPAVFDLKNNHLIQLCNEEMPDIIFPHKGEGKAALGYSDIAYKTLITWDRQYRDYYLVNLGNGEKKQLLEKHNSTASLSPDMKFLVYYSTNDSSWFSKSTSDATIKNLTSGIKYSFTDEEHDTPDDAGSYGVAGWTDAGDILIYDRYDIWQIDVSGNKPAHNLTQGYGRQNQIRIRYFKTQKEEKFIASAKPLYFKGFDEKTKGSVILRLKNLKSDDLLNLYSGNFELSTPIKAENTDSFIFTQETFNQYSDIHLTNKDFKSFKKLSDANPQQKNYIWGNAHLYEWISKSGMAMQGLLYLPENHDNKTPLPCVVYFYEKYSDGLYSYHSPRPSRSTISFSYYASNGYAVFVPDIRYKTGSPGESAYDCIVSGVEKLISDHIIDAERIGIQGQSWGGYQVAYLITRTNLFKAAMAGAPVSNMTSAYGGIRWGSGMSRMFQYEKTQSRIGATLWEKPELYIENSPLFFAPEIQTPLLIMSNDNDGAVPWYQGIELYTAMRRLNKPAWLLNYNNDEHNLKAESWGNRIDLSIRMQQFFDHYLKNLPAPRWLTEGIQATEKGLDLKLDIP